MIEQDVDPAINFIGLCLIYSILLGYVRKSVRVRKRP